MNTPQPQDQPGWLQSLADRFNFDDFLQRFNLSTAVILEIIAYAGAGFLAGFLFKRYFKFALVLIILFFLALKGMEYAGVGSMILNWDRVRELTGFGPSDTLESVVRTQLVWIQMHVRQTISFVVGFLIGIRVG
jgi:uncharacterized membrane protein (Fun14 family)